MSPSDKASTKQEKANKAFIDLLTVSTEAPSESESVRRVHTFFFFRSNLFFFGACWHQLPLGSTSSRRRPGQAPFGACEHANQPKSTPEHVLPAHVYNVTRCLRQSSEELQAVTVAVTLKLPPNNLN